MSEDNVIDFKDPASKQDLLTIIAKDGAQRMLQVALEAEVTDFINCYSDRQLPDGARQVVRNGYLPDRNIQSGIGDLAVKVARVRDRSDEGIKFASKIVPKYLRRSTSVNDLLP